MHGNLHKYTACPQFPVPSTQGQGQGWHYFSEWPLPSISFSTRSPFTIMHQMRTLANTQLQQKYFLGILFESEYPLSKGQLLSSFINSSLLKKIATNSEWKGIKALNAPQCWSEISIWIYTLIFYNIYVMFSEYSRSHWALLQ